MDILYDVPPMAGERFRFRVVDGAGLTRIEVYLGPQHLKTAECDDPPCHQMIVVPPNARGLTLQIKARDTEGHSVKLELPVGDTEAGASGMTAAAG